MCPLMGIRILAALVTRKKWRIDNELKNEYAFLNSITEMRNVFVLPPADCASRYKVLWLLTAAFYGFFLIQIPNRKSKMIMPTSI